MKEFKWTARRELAAFLVARGGITGKEIGDAVGVWRFCIQRWKNRPEFQERVAELRAAFAEAVKGYEIADRDKRVEALNDRWERMRRLIEARAVQYADVPGGGDTGLLVPKRARGRTKRARRKTAKGGKGLRSPSPAA